jgi:hypothetical protein
MLKNLISLFAEQFLTNKKGWIGHQAMPSTRLELDTSLRQYLAPSDGWISVRAVSSSFDIFVTNPAIVVRCSCYATTFSSTTATLPIAKGQKFVISSIEGVTEMWFSPSNGATT